MTIDYFSLGHPLTGIRSYFSLRARKKMFGKFMQVMHPSARDKVLDVGVTPDRTLPESNFFELYYPYKQNLTAASIEDASFLEDMYPGLKFIQVRPGKLPFTDNEFDIVFCSAVIEHVGDDSAQQAFVAELLRVSKKFFITTPNRQFPLDFHTFIPFTHWLPRAAHQRILQWLGLHFWSKTENLNLLSPKRLMSLFTGCRTLQLYLYRLLGLPSNIVVYGEK